MKHVILGLAVASLAAGATYAAENSNRMMPDADGDGVVTRAEMQAYAAQRFAHVDMNSDSKIDQADRVAMRAQRFDRMDTDKNGQISREEFEAASPMRNGPAMGPGHGAGGGHGMEPGPGMGPGDGMGRGMSRTDVDHMILRRADTNKDGIVDQAEYTAGMLRHFDHADANHDGKVTKDEWRAASAKRRDRAGHGDGPCPMKPAPAE